MTDSLSFSDAALERQYLKSRKPMLLEIYKIYAIVCPVGCITIGILSELLFPSSHLACDRIAVLASVLFLNLVAGLSVFCGKGRVKEELTKYVYAGNLLGICWLTLAAGQEQKHIWFLLLIFMMVTAPMLAQLRFWECVKAVTGTGILYGLAALVKPIGVTQNLPYLVFLGWSVVYALVTSYEQERINRAGFWQQRVIDRNRQEIAAASEKIAGLLDAVLPPGIAARMREGEVEIAETFDEVSILFADVVNFTVLSEKLSSAEVVRLLNEVFKAFDGIVERYGLEKIKTIGDCYMIASGVPVARPDHLHALARAAVDMIRLLPKIARDLPVPIAIRIGLHTGPVTAGIIGKTRPAYDLWGDTVNTASRMESCGRTNRIHVTEAVRAALAGSYSFEGPNQLQVKGKGEMVTWFLSVDA